AELYDPGEEARGPVPPAVPLRFEPRELARGIDPGTAGLAVLDADGDGRPDLLVWSAAGAALWRGGAARGSPGGPEGLRGGGGPGDSPPWRQPFPTPPPAPPSARPWPALPPPASSITRGGPSRPSPSSCPLGRSRPPSGSTSITTTTSTSSSSASARSSCG